MALFENNLDALLQPAIADDWEYDCRLALQKITEALRDAKARVFGFLGGTEIYGGPLGMMN